MSHHCLKPPSGNFLLQVVSWRHWWRCREWFMTQEHMTSPRMLFKPRSFIHTKTIGVNLHHFTALVSKSLDAGFLLQSRFGQFTCAKPRDQPEDEKAQQTKDKQPWCKRGKKEGLKKRGSSVRGKNWVWSTFSVVSQIKGSPNFVFSPNVTRRPGCPVLKQDRPAVLFPTKHFTFQKFSPWRPPQPLTGRNIPHTSA